MNPRNLIDTGKRVDYANQSCPVMQDIDGTHYLKWQPLNTEYPRYEYCDAAGRRVFLQWVYSDCTPAFL